MPAAQRPPQVMIDLNRTAGSSMLPDGVYDATIKKVEVKQGPKGPYLDLQVSIAGGSGLIFEKISTSQGARFRMEAMLDSIGLPKKGAPISPTSLTGKRGKVQIGNESYEGKLKNVIANWLSPEIAAQMQATAPIEALAPEAVDDAFATLGSGDEDQDFEEDFGDEGFLEEDDEFPT